MKLLLLLLLAGLCSGLHYPLQYRYQYRARVSAGIPEINRDLAAVSDLRAELDVFVSSPTRVTFKLHDVEIGNVHGTVPCDNEINEPLPVEYLSPDDVVPNNALGQHAFAMENGTYIFNQEDPQWVVNFYKSIIGFFTMPLLKETFYESSNYHIGLTSYDEIEDTVMGNCISTYTQHKLSGVSQSELPVVPEDCQAGPAQINLPPGSKSPGGRKIPGGRKVPRRGTKTPSKTRPSQLRTCPDIGSDYWEVVRSVNLDLCGEGGRVEFMHAPSGIHCSYQGDQCKNLFSRNSHGVYKLRGDENSIRLEQAEIEGATTISPYGYTTEHPRTITKQSLSLIRVQNLDIATAPDLDQVATKSVNHLLSELTTAFSEEDVQNSKWAKAGTFKESREDLLAVHITDEMTKETEENVVKTVNSVVGMLATESNERAEIIPMYLNYAENTMVTFTEDGINNVLRGFSGNTQALNLMWDMLAGVGTPSAVNVLINAMTDGQISSFRQVTVFGSLNNNIKSATALRPLLDFLVNQDLEASPYKTSQSVINFASVVNRICLTSRTDIISSVGVEQCGRDNIVGRMEEHLIAELEGANSFWKQMVLIQALVNLKTVTATNALLPYILGAKECDTMVRSVAMDSLASWNAPGIRSKSTPILLDIMENPAEHRLLRGRALGYLISAPLNAPAWTRLAFLTRRPGNKDLAALIYSVIKSTAEYSHPDNIKQMQYASHALTLARPTSSAERYSSFQTWKKYSFSDQIGSVDHIATIKDPSSPLPSEIAVYIRRSLGGAVFFKKINVMLSNDDGDIEKTARELFFELYLSFTRGHATSGRWTTFHNMLKADLNIVEKARGIIKGMLNFVPFKGMQFFIPFEKKMLVDALLAISDESPALNINNHNGGLYVSRLSFLATVNDLGLPVIISTSTPSFIHHKGDFRFYQGGLTGYAVSSLSNNIVAAIGHQTLLDTFIPWTQSVLSTGASNRKAVRLPFSPNIQIDFPSPVQRKPEHDGSFVLNLAPSATGKVVLAHESNIPFTFVRSTVPQSFEDAGRDYQPVFKAGGPLQKTHMPLPLGITLDHQGDVRTALEPGNILKMFQGQEDNMNRHIMSPSLKFHSTQISVDFPSTRDSSITLNITRAYLDRTPSSGRFVSHYGQDSFEEYELCGSKAITQSTGQQYTQDYMDQTDSQFAQSAQDEYESFGSFGSQQAAKAPERYSVQDEATDAETGRPSQGIGDVTEPQLSSFLHYLQREAGWTSRVDGLSVRVEITKNNDVTEAIEAVMGYTVCYSLLDRQQTQFVLVVARKDDDCSTECIEGVTEQPKLNDLDTLALIMAKNLSQHSDLNFYHGANCGSGPYLTLKEVGITFPPTIEAIKNTITSKQACHSEPKDGVQVEPIDMVEEFHKLAKYDVIGLQKNFTMTRDLDNSCSIFVNPVTSAYGMFRKHILQLPPKLTQCQLNDGPVQYGTKIISSHLVFEREKNKQDDGNYHFTERHLWDSTEEYFMPLPRFLTELHHLTTPFHHEPSDYCIISPSSTDTSSNSFYLTTFDKRFEKIELDSCPVLAATPCEENKLDTFVLAVKINRDNSLAMNIASQYKQLVINIDADGVEINREPMDANTYVKTLYYSDEQSNRQMEAGHVYRRNGFYKVEVQDAFEILFKEGKFYIKLADRYHGYSCGICGNHDGEPSNDLTSPNGCLVSDTQDFVKMWTPSTSFDCSPLEQPSIDSCVSERPLPHDYYQQHQL